jgi:drug/metabolite transporter (DMT)-like permease
VTALLALLSAGLVGGADFVGGAVSRRLPPARVAAIAQLAGLALAIPAALLVDWERVTTGDIVWSVVSGVSVGLGLALFYTGMQRGMISLVAPVTAAVGASIPAAWGLARGESPGIVVIAGMVLAVVAIVIVSLAPGEGDTSGQQFALLCSLGAGLLFGVFFVALALTDPDAGLWPVPISRVASAASLVGVALVMTRGLRLPRDTAPTVALIGVLEVCAAVTLLLALQRGPVSVAAVLASMYPVTTVLLAAGVLHERLSRAQMAGVGLAFVAVLLVSAG